MQSETVETNPFGMEFENVPLNKEALKGGLALSLQYAEHFMDLCLPQRAFCFTSAYL